MINRFAKLRLTPDDLPEDVESLQEGIIQIRRLLNARPVGRIARPNFSKRDELLCELLLAKGQFENGKEVLGLNCKKKNIALSKLRKKLKGLGIIVPLHANMIDPHSRARLGALFRNGEASMTVPVQKKHDVIENLLHCRLPDNRQMLCDIFLTLIENLRGNPAEIQALVPQPSRAILFSTLLARRGDVVTKEVLYTALYTPFTHDPRGRSAVEMQISLLRRNLNPIGATITTYKDRGYQIDDASNQVIFAWVRRGSSAEQHLARS